MEDSSAKEQDGEWIGSSSRSWSAQGFNKARKSLPYRTLTAYNTEMRDSSGDERPESVQHQRQEQKLRWRPLDNLAADRAKGKVRSSSPGLDPSFLPS